jgi:ATP-dependent Clp protease ATP-binding subunit ClpA
MKAGGHALDLSADAFEYVVRNGFSEEYGARRLLGVIRESVEGSVSDALRSGRPTSGVLVENENGDGLGLSATRLGAM